MIVPSQPPLGSPPLGPPLPSGYPIADPVVRGAGFANEAARPFGVGVERYGPGFLEQQRFIGDAHAAAGQANAHRAHVAASAPRATSSPDWRNVPEAERCAAWLRAHQMGSHPQALWTLIEKSDRESADLVARFLKRAKAIPPADIPVGLRPVQPGWLGRRLGWETGRSEHMTEPGYTIAHGLERKFGEDLMTVKLSVLADGRVVARVSFRYQQGPPSAGPSDPGAPAAARIHYTPDEPDAYTSGKAYFAVRDLAAPIGSLPIGLGCWSHVPVGRPAHTWRHANGIYYSIADTTIWFQRCLYDWLLARRLVEPTNAVRPS